MQEFPSLSEIEENTRVETLNREGKALTVIENLLNQYLSGFQHIGEFKRTDDNRLEQVWLLLTLRAFNSLRWGYYLLQSGYYSQSMMLTRSALEDWLVCKDCEGHVDTVEAVLDWEKHVPTFKAMADRLPEKLQLVWKEAFTDDGIYGFLSTFAHPRYRAIHVLFDPDTKLLSLGPSYDEHLFLITCYSLFRPMIWFMEFLYRLVDPVAPDWKAEAQPVMNQAHKSSDQLLTRAKALLKATE